MNILYCTIEDLAKHGGGKTHFANLSYELATAGHNVYICSPKYRWSSTPAIPEGCIDASFRVIGGKSPLGVFVYELLLALLACRLRIRRRIDVVLMRGSGLTVLGGLLFLWFRLWGMYVVLEVNGISWEELRAQGMHKVLRAYVKAMVWQCAKTANRVICVTEAIAVEIARISKKSPCAVYVVPNGVRCDVFKPSDSRATLRREFGWHQEDLVVIMPSSFTPWHGVDALVTAVSFLPAEIRQYLRVVLPGVGEGRARIARLVQDFELGSHILLPGALSQDQLARMCSASDIGVFLCLEAGKLRFPGSPLKFYEYLGAGLPVFVVNDSHVGYLTSTKGLGFVVADLSSEGIAEALARVFERRAELPGIGVRNRQLAEQAFSWTRTAERVARICSGATIAELTVDNFIRHVREYPVPEVSYIAGGRDAPGVVRPC
jgi:glycosyltransferase involved in cell wall biosynthesis